MPSKTNTDRGIGDYFTTNQEKILNYHNEIIKRIKYRLKHYIDAPSES
jgi:hypothetical protein